MTRKSLGRFRLLAHYGTGCSFQIRQETFCGRSLYVIVLRQRLRCSFGSLVDGRPVGNSRSHLFFGWPSHGLEPEIHFVSVKAQKPESEINLFL